MKNKKMLETVWNLIVDLSWQSSNETKLDLMNELLPLTEEEEPYEVMEDWTINFIYSKIIMYDFMVNMGYSDEDRDEMLDLVNNE